MPINKDLNASPYFDDFDEDKNFYKILFKPRVAVQTRELNQLHSILQNQIERFGNNIYKRGTIIDGVNFVYYPNYSYIKLTDNQLDGLPAVPSLYVGNFVVDPTSNLTAHVINYADGYESTDPDLKTLYLRYINSGTDGNTTSFSPNTTLTVYDYLDSINQMSVVNGSSGFSNNDTVVFCSAVSVNVSSSNTFIAGETVYQSGNTRFAVIDSITSYKGGVVLKIKPRQSDLTNTAITDSVWQFDNQQTIYGSVTGAVATVNQSIGNSATASIVTNADVGKITNVIIGARGQGYFIEPYVSIKSSGETSNYGARNYNDLNLQAKNYVAQVTVSSKANTVGYGYAFGVTDGIIYQKGYFSKVLPQTVIVSKYDSQPDGVSVGFDTTEEIINSNIDQSLLDNSSGTPNQYAPGADRLKLTPSLVVVVNTEEASSNGEFLSLVEFSEGQPYRENKRTQYDSINDEMATRTNDQSGNFVLDKFLVTTASSNSEGTSFNIVVDSGKAYVNGYRVQTDNYYITSVDKGTDFGTTSGVSNIVDYGNYILVTEAAGVFNFNTGDFINLLDTTHAYVSNTSLINSGSIPTTGDTVIGTARIRNCVYDDGGVGNSTTSYRIYLFDIHMNTGCNFADVKGVRTQSGNGIADVVLVFDATSSRNVNKLYDSTNGNSLLVYTGSDATKSIANLEYVYRMTNQSVNLANTGILSYLLSDSQEYFAYTSPYLTDEEKKSVILVPTSNNVILTPNTSYDGTANITSSSNTISITSANTINAYQAGDFIALWSNLASPAYSIRRVTGKTANTLILDSTAGFTNAAASISRAYPKNVPVPLNRIPSATANVTSGGKSLNINIGNTHYSTAAVNCAITFDVSVVGASAQPKTAERDNFVKLNLSTANTTGPWCIGAPDVFRLKAVYMSSSSTVNTNSTDVTNQFYVDHNQNGDFYDLSYLYLRSDASITLSSSTWLLVKFDAFTSSGGLFTVNSYVSSNTAQRLADDSLSLSALGSKTNSFEIPEFTGSDGKYYDLINYIDFRPVANPTITYAKTAALANTNPSSALSFSGSNKKFPLPESGVGYDRSFFMGRRDLVIASPDGAIKVIRGVASDSQPYSLPKTPSNTMLLNSVLVPAYPCVPQNFSSTTKEILDKKMVNERVLVKRVKDRTIKTEVSDSDIQINQPRAYTMADIGKLERRISDLEYSVSLSLVEADLRDKNIPSQISPDAERFKFGFFVDDYSTDKNSDTDNVEYQCEVIDSRVKPVGESILVTFGGGYKLGSWTSEYSLVKQNIASEVPVVIPAPPPETQPPVVVTPPTVNNTPIPAPDPTPAPVVVPVPVTPNTSTTYVKAVDTTQAKVKRFTYMSTYNGMDVVPVTMSSVNGYFNVNYDFGKSRDWLTILKGNQVIYNEHNKNTGYLTFFHNASTGRDYTFKVTTTSDWWTYDLDYPVDETIYVSPNSPSVNSSVITYNGQIYSMSPESIAPTSLTSNFGSVVSYLDGVFITVTVKGLKPNTIHYASIVDEGLSVSVLNYNFDWDYYTSPFYSSGNSIVSDSLGSATFTVKITAKNSNIDSITKNFNSYGTNINALTVLFTSGDSTSQAVMYVKTSVVDTTSTQQTVAQSLGLLRNSFAGGILSLK